MCIEKEVLVLQRFDMKAGLAERFGDDIFSKLEKHHQVEQQGINPAGVKFKWLLTKRVRVWNLCP